MKKPSHPRAVFTAIGLTVLSMIAPTALAAPPDLTAAGVIATIGHTHAYNLGATGLRGWIYSTATESGFPTQNATGTVESRQILVTVASTPGTAMPKRTQAADGSTPKRVQMATKASRQAKQSTRSASWATAPTW